jgi:two-component system phosphate regulon response regulator PhoB
LQRALFEWRLPARRERWLQQHDPARMQAAFKSDLPVTDRVLLVDDEPDLRELLAFNLGQAGFATEAVGTGEDGIDAARRLSPAVIVLDVMLPDQPGTTVCARLRADPPASDPAILLLTARGDEADKVLGFEAGADDYVVKPFSVREVVMRVRALARRARERTAARKAADHGERLAWRELVVDPVRHRVEASGAPLELRPLEFKLLAILLEHPGRVFSRAELLEEVWGITADVTTRTVDTHVRRLRERLGAYGQAIETVHGFGYRLREP